VKDLSPAVAPATRGSRPPSPRPRRRSQQLLLADSIIASAHASNADPSCLGALSPRAATWQFPAIRLTRYYKPSFCDSRDKNTDTRLLVTSIHDILLSSPGAFARPALGMLNRSGSGRNPYQGWMVDGRISQGSSASLRNHWAGIRNPFGVPGGKWRVPGYG